MHFFLECNNYSDNRDVMLNKINQFIDIHAMSNKNILNIILYGCNSLSDEDNIHIFDSVHKYIKCTGRFNR